MATEDPAATTSNFPLPELRSEHHWEKVIQRHIMLLICGIAWFYKFKACMRVCECCMNTYEVHASFWSEFEPAPKTNFQK